MQAKLPDTMVCVGAIAGAFGVKGEARIKSFCADPGAIGDYGPLSTEGGRQFDLTITRAVKEGFAAHLSGVPTREAAEDLKGTRLYAPRDALPSLPEDEFYHADLLGLEVVDTGGIVLGRIRAVHDFGAGDVLDIVGGERPLMLPFTREAVPTVDLTAGRVVADPPGEISERDPDDG